MDTRAGSISPVQATAPEEVNPHHRYRLKSKLRIARCVFTHHAAP